MFSDGLANVLLPAYHQLLWAFDKDSDRNTGGQNIQEKGFGKTHFLASNGFGSRFSFSTVFPSIMRILGVPGV